LPTWWSNKLAQPGFEVRPELVRTTATHAGGFEDLLGGRVWEAQGPQSGNGGQEECHVG